MRKPSMFAGALLAATLSAPHGASSADQGLQVWIEPVVNDDMVEFSGYVTASEPVAVTYEMKITRVTQGGTSSTTQSGRTNIGASGATAMLSRTGINLGPNDRIDIDLTARGSNGETANFQYTTD